MSRQLIHLDVPLDVPAEAAWAYITDWERQGEWIPRTRVELVDPDDPGHRVGGRIRAWSGVGPIGFWDTMTITSWDERPDGGGSCEVLHTGAVVRGEGVFAVQATGPDSSRFLWSEMAVVPGGAVGALGWRLVQPVVERLLRRGLTSLRERLAREHRLTAGATPYPRD